MQRNFMVAPMPIANIFRRLRIVGAIALALLAVGVTASVSSAHAYLVRSEPADGLILDEAPPEIRLWFDEPISSQFSSVQLLDVDSQPVEITSLRVDAADPKLMILTVPELPEGAYSVLYKALSETDGHFSQGLLVFGVGPAADLGNVDLSQSEAASVSSPEVALRWFNFTLLAILVGAVAMAQLVLDPERYTSGRETQAYPIIKTARRRLVGLARWAALLAIITGFGLLAWQVHTLTANLPEGASITVVVRQVLGETRWGRAWMARQVTLILLSAILFLLNKQEMDVRPGPANGSRLSQGVPWSAAMILALILIISQVFTSHASGLSEDTALALLVDGLHLLAASVWVGGLVVLAISLLPLLRNRDDFSSLVKACWKPFSFVAALSVGLLIASGLYNTGRQVASIDALLTTLYGRALLSKIGLVLAVGAVGLVNSSLLHSRLASPLARVFKKPAGWTPLNIRRLPALIILEGSLGLMVLLATGLITASPAPRGSDFTIAPGEVPNALSQTVEDMVITFGAKPNRPGQNVFTVFAASSRRPPRAEIARVILRFDYLEQDIGRVTATAEEIEPGRYMIGGNYLNLAGEWQVEVVVRRLGLEDSVAQFNWLVAPPGEARPVVVSKAPIELPLTFGAAILLLLVLSIAIVFWLVRSKSAVRFHTVDRPSDLYSPFLRLCARPRRLFLWIRK